MVQGAAYIVIEGPGHDHTRHTLQEGITSLGRLSANDIILLGDLVSRHHARITFFEGRATLQDLDSHNGCWIDSERVNARVLEHGDAIQLGNFQITFRVALRDEQQLSHSKHTRGVPADNGEVELNRDLKILIDEIQAAQRGDTPNPSRAMHFLYRASDALARSNDLRAYGEHMLKLAVEHAPADEAFWLRQNNQQQFRIEASLHESDISFPAFFEPAVEWAIHKKFPIRAENVLRDPRFADALHAQPPSGAIMVVPMLAVKEVGALYLRRQSQRFEAAETNLVSVVAHLMKEGMRDIQIRQTIWAEKLLSSLYSPYIAKRFSANLGGGGPSYASLTSIIVVMEIHGLAENAHKYPPALLFDFLAMLQTEASRYAEHMGGFAQPLNGHRIMLVLGLPTGLTKNSARAAIESAQAIQTRVESMLRGKEKLGPQRLCFGVASGEIVTGIATGQQRYFSVLGPAVSRALFLAQSAPEGAIWIDEYTGKKSGRHFDLRRIEGSQSTEVLRGCIYELAEPIRVS